MLSGLLALSMAATSGDQLASWCEQNSRACDIYIAGYVDGVEQELFLREDARDFCLPTSWTSADGRRVFLARWKNNMRNHDGAWKGNKASTLLWTVFSNEYPCRRR
ncbi:Rap1a/Tai family immunity protein [Erythrobacter crassostreae]|uniref:Rap1a immunity protein domain-containing protein n=1 Tax=Erythrobacter crassostreae TaxID=2828328 RepID=A0A9X1F3K0_9SPHN|nr:Rap1a/Tai family immunity protein [Erythrobacter crassostrea]MBV7259617.1 hypothetical protein [Erythrobacter crassostrea]